jgi:hypothetical protein
MRGIVNAAYLTGDSSTRVFAGQVVGFQYELHAVKFRRELVERLGKFDLEVEPTKTRVTEFGKFAVRKSTLN